MRQPESDALLPVNPDKPPKPPKTMKKTYQKALSLAEGKESVKESDLLVPILVAVADSKSIQRKGKQTLIMLFNAINELEEKGVRVDRDVMFALVSAYEKIKEGKTSSVNVSRDLRLDERISRQIKKERKGVSKKAVMRVLAEFLKEYLKSLDLYRLSGAYEEITPAVVPIRVNRRTFSLTVIIRKTTEKEREKRREEKVSWNPDARPPREEEPKDLEEVAREIEKQLREFEQPPQEEKEEKQEEEEREEESPKEEEKKDHLAVLEEINFEALDRAIEHLRRVGERLEDLEKRSYSVLEKVRNLPPVPRLSMGR